MADRISLSYQPPGETLRAFRASDAFARALIGPMQGGRRTCAVHDIMLRAAFGSQRRWRWVVVRADRTLLDEQTIAAWHRWVPASIGTWDARALRHQIAFVVGGKPRDLDIQLFAWDTPDHRRRLATIEATGFWLDGARELDESVFDRALDAAGLWPVDEPPAGLVICTSRMPASDHWLARRRELAMFRQPGGRSPQAENLQHLKPGFYQRAAARRSADRVRVEIDAEFGVSAVAIAEARRLREDVLGRLGRLDEAMQARLAELRAAAQRRDAAA